MALSFSKLMIPNATFMIRCTIKIEKYFKSRYNVEYIRVI